MCSPRAHRLLAWRSAGRLRGALNAHQCTDAQARHAVTQDAALEAYLNEAASWDKDRAQMQRRSARIAWVVAGAGWISTLAGAMALMILMPLKRVEPFVIRVDNL